MWRILTFLLTLNHQETSTSRRKCWLLRQTNDTSLIVCCHFSTMPINLPEMPLHHSHSWCKTLCHELQSALTRSCYPRIDSTPLPPLINQDFFSGHMLKGPELEPIHVCSVRWWLTASSYQCCLIVTPEAYATAACASKDTGSSNLTDGFWS